METDITKVKTNVANSIITRLGGNIIDVELDIPSLFKCIDIAINTLRQHSDASVDESIVLLNLIQNQKEYVLPKEIIGIERIYRQGYGRGNLSGSNLNPFAFQSFCSFYSIGLLGSNNYGSLMTIEANNQFLKTLGKMSGMYMNYNFNENTHILTLAENPRANQELVALHAYVDRPDYMLLQDRYSGIWIENYATAEAKEILGEIRGRFSSLPGPQGQVSQNNTALKAEAKDMKEKLMKELNHGEAGGYVTNSIFSG